MPKPRIHTGWMIAAIVGELLLLAWLFRSKWMPAPTPAAYAPDARRPSVPAPAPAMARATKPPPSTTSAGAPFTADICGVGKVPLVEKSHDPDDDVWIKTSHDDADGNVVDDPPQPSVDPNALSRRDQAIEDWLMQRTARTFTETGAALRNSGDARLLAFSLFLGKYDLDKGGWTGSPAHERVALAQGTRDPVLYGIVYGSCGGMSTPFGKAIGVPGCEAVTAKHWAELDPQNAVPWLVVALEAEAGGDAAALADAMHHAAQARTYDTYAGTLMNAVDRRIQGEPDSLEHVAVESTLLENVARTRHLYLEHVLRYCASSRVGIEGRRAECDRIADLLITPGATSYEWEVGLHVAGITDPGQPALESARQLFNLMIFDGHPAGAHWTCRYRDQQQKLIQAYLSGGGVAERLALREQFDPAPPAPSKEQIDQIDQYLEHVESTPLFRPTDLSEP